LPVTGFVPLNSRTGKNGRHSGHLSDISQDLDVDDILRVYSDMLSDQFPRSFLFMNMNFRKAGATRSVCQESRADLIPFLLLTKSQKGKPSKKDLPY